MPKKCENVLIEESIVNEIIKPKEITKKVLLVINLVFVISVKKNFFT